MSQTTKVLAWHFLADDGRLASYNTANGKGRLVTPGQTIRVKPPVRLCKHGLHGSIRALDGLGYAPGSIVCRTEHSGQIEYGTDKLCSSVRKCLWMADATRTLHLFACDIAEAALTKERKAEREPDARSWRAIEVKRLWLDGKATDEELDAAWSAASSAATSAASSAATSAAYGAATSAAYGAATSAAYGAAWSAARSAAYSAANERLEAMLLALEPMP